MTAPGSVITLSGGRVARWDGSRDLPAISVHTAQDAEFPADVIPLITSHAPMLGRTLLYTVLTRARQLVVLVGQQKALFLAVRDWRRSPRHTALGRLLDGSLQLRWRSRLPDAEDILPIGLEGFMDEADQAGA